MRIDRKAIIFLLILVLFSILLGCTNKSQRGNSTMDSEITQYVDKDYSGSGVDILLSDFTEFDWDRVLVFNYPTSAKEIENALNVQYDGSLDLISGIIFVKGDKITYEEIFKDDYESPPRFFIYPNRDINARPKYRVFTRDTAAFECIRQEYKDYNYYKLIPKE